MAEEDFESKCRRFRVHVLREIYETEETFTRKIEFVVQHVLYNARDRKTLFTDQILSTIFCNIEDILAHHQSLIASVKTCTGDGNVQYESLLATCYLKHIEGFDVYSKYGSNHEQAQRALKEVLQDPKILAFFSGCILLGGMGDECRMDSFLVMPIQRICKYPLLMKELLKYTPADHPDFYGVQQCLEKMKGICNATNEAKRRWEKLEEIAEWQSTVEGWEGPDITESCIEMVLKGQLTKISAGNSQERQIFLLDNSLVYCKKTASHAVPSKRRRSSSISDNSVKVESSVVSNLLFRGRIALDNLDIENIEDGTKDYHSHGVSVYNGWKVHNLTKNKWFVLIAKDSREKQEWIDAIRREKAKRKSRAMGIAHSTRQMSLIRGDKIYNNMKKEAGSVIKDHKLKLRTHPNCFTGSDLVSWLVMSKEASDEDQAVIIGQGLLESGVIHHVLDKHNFQNNNLLYRFRYDDGTFRVKQESKYLLTGGLRIYLSLVGHHNALIKDLKSTFSSSKNVLSGAKLMDWMIQNEIVQNREEGMAVAKDLFGIKMLRHINDEQGFKDVSGVYYRFTPDDGHDGESSSKAKVDLNYRKTFSCANIEVPFTFNDYGFELNLVEQKVKVLDIVEQKLKVVSVTDKGRAQARGLCEGQVVVGINGRILSTSEKRHADSIIKGCVRNSSPISLLIERGSSYICDLHIGSDEGLGFHIKGHSPVVIYATDPGLPAARAGVVPGSCILEVNGNKMMQLGHDDVVKEIRKSLSVKSNGLHLRLAQPGLEHVMEYRFESNESQQLLCYEHMFEALCTFSVPAQLLFLFGTNMAKFAEDINQFRSDDLKIAHFVDELNKVVTTTNKHATTLKLHSQSRWPSYKPYGVQSNKLLDGCPTNCHTHVLTVTTTDDGNDLIESMEVSQNGTMENGWESELQDCTRYVFTTMAAPSLFTGSQKLSEAELVQLQTVKEQLALLVHVTEELRADEEYIEKLVNESKMFSGSKNQLGVSMSHFGIKSLTRGMLPPTPENSPLTGRRLSESFPGLTPDASPMMDRRRATSISDPQPLLRLVVQGMVLKLPKILSLLKHQTIKHAFKETVKFSKDYHGYHQLLGRLEEDSTQLSHDLEDSCMHPSDSTITAAKNFVACVNKHIKECCKHIKLYIATHDDVLLFQRDQHHFSQCLSAVLSTLTCQLTAALSGQYNPERHYISDNTEASTKWLEQIAAIGVLVKFEALMLPDRDNELLQLKLLRSTVSLLKNVELHFKIQDDSSVGNALTPQVTCEGDQYGLHVTFMLPAHLKDKCPDQLLSSQGVKIHPILFTKDLIQCTNNGSIGEINVENFRTVNQYYKSYRAFKFDKNSLPTDRDAIKEAIHQLSQPLTDLDKLINQLSKEVSADQRSGVGVLSLSTELCQRLGAVQIILCDSGVHRSVMSLSLEQMCTLVRCHGLPIRSLRSGVTVLRRNGAYQVLMQKNQTDANNSFPKEPLKLYQPPLKM